MKRTDLDLPQVSATRRDFLRAASALAVLGSMPATCGPAAAAGQEMKPVVIRGHHLFDMLDALGKGRSDHKTLGPVALRIRANPKVPIKLVVGVDDICGPCQWWDHKKGLCTRSLEKYPRDNEDSLACDRNAIRVLGMKPGDMVPAAELYRLIKAKVTKKVFAEEVCVACRLVNKCKETYEPKIEAAVKALAAPHA